MSTSLRRLVTGPLVQLGRAYNATAQKWPAATGVGTTVIKTSAADLFAQMVVEKKKWEEVDWKRHGVFCTFGLFYLGGFQYWLYNHLFVRMCAGMTQRLGHLGSAPIKTFIDQAIHHPLFYFPTLYAMKGYVEERPLASTVEKYKEDLWDNCKALWMIWVPAQLVNFAFVPRHLRIPFVAGVSFLWTVVLSTMRGAIEMAKAAGPTTAELEQTMAGLASAAVTPASADASAAPVMHGAALLGGAARGTHSSEPLGLRALVAPGEPRAST